MPGEKEPAATPIPTLPQAGPRSPGPADRAEDILDDKLPPLPPLEAYEEARR